ncbi:MAG: glycosyltransferase family 4 protein [Acidobacteria bacterium]|nr:glycosyltransferase family 4 protein [Acidobacteriota bacterium]MBI3281598.1 glycosyltransferase family 4 protein [Acidobacteriota bacterium]
MHVQIDATSLLLRSAGVKNYTYYWLNALRQAGSHHRFSAFPALGELGALRHESSVVGPWATLPRIALLHFANIRFNPAMEFLTAGVDVFHASNQVRNPPRRKLLSATLFDMTCTLMPGKHTRANVRAERNFAERVLKRAAGVISISENTKNDAVKLIGLDPRRIAVIYPGVSGAFFAVSEAQKRAAAIKYGLHKPYVLFVGTVEPRKNIDVLLDAWQQLPPALHEQFDLIIAGSIGWSPENTVRRLQGGIAGVRHTGYVPEADLPALTGGAALFVYPSLYEGFGLPLAQAMAAGVPVITSAVSSLPEVAGPAGLLVDPRSPSELRAAIQRALASPSLLEKMSHAGSRRAREFTWDRCARQSIEFFEGLG